MHPKDKGFRRNGGGDGGSTSATVTRGEGRRRKEFWVYVGKDEPAAIEGFKTDERSTTRSTANGNAISMDSGYVNIGANNVHKWELLKETHGYVSDGDFATFLLDSLAVAEQMESTGSVSAAPRNMKIATHVDDKGNSGHSISIEESKDADRDEKSNDRSTTMDEVDSDMIDVKQEGEGVEENEGDADYESTCDEDQSDDSGESMSEDEKDVEWTPASFLCETQFARQSSDKETKGLRQTRRRMATVSNPKSKRKTSSADLNLSGEKKVRRRHSICIDCNGKHSDSECPLTRPVMVVVDMPTMESDNVHHSIAESSLPKMLTLAITDKNHGPSVVAVEDIFKYTQFGPLIGERIKEPDIREDMDLKHIWEIFGNNFKLYIDTYNENKSNWLRFMRPAASKSELNVSVIAKEDELYFVTTKDIETGTELFYWVEDPTWSWPKTIPVKTTCHSCKKRFRHPLYYRMHCVIFHDPNCGFGLRKFQCKICGIAVLGRDALRQHASEMHGGKGAYQCEYCKKFLLRLHSLEAHRTYSCKLNPRRCRPLCELCGKEFSFPQKLKVHMRRMHSDNVEILKEFECKSCSKLMSSRACLQRHMNEVHAMNEVATCDRCGKTFQNKSNLKIHMLTHSGVKPFRCAQTDCAAAFTTKQCLQFHYKKVHDYTTDNMPVIERCVAYTFENYSGGVSDGGDESHEIAELS